MHAHTQHCHSPVNLPSILESSTTKVVLTSRSVSLFLLDKPKAIPNQSTIKRTSSLKSLCFALISKKVQDNNRLSRLPVSCFLSPRLHIKYPVLVFLSVQTAISPFPSLSFQRHPVNRDCHHPETETALTKLVNNQQCDNPSNFHDSLKARRSCLPLLTSTSESKSERETVKFFQPKTACQYWPLINLSYQESNTHLKPSFGLTLSK